MIKPRFMLVGTRVCCMFVTQKEDSIIKVKIHNSNYGLTYFTWTPFEWTCFFCRVLFRRQNRGLQGCNNTGLTIYTIIYTGTGQLRASRNLEVRFRDHDQHWIFRPFHITKVKKKINFNFRAEPRRIFSKS